jgi:hypothetical protein
MDGHYFEFKEFKVPEAVSLTFHGFNLVIGPFQRTGLHGADHPTFDTQL